MDTITVGDLPGEAQEWLDGHGYQAGHLSVYGYSGFGIVFGRINEAAHLVMPGQTLVWDGTDVTVQVAP